jgi:hypothetical protein
MLIVGWCVCCTVYACSLLENCCWTDTDPYNKTTRYCEDPTCRELRAQYDHALQVASRGVSTNGKRLIPDCHGMLVNAKTGLLAWYDVNKLLHAFCNDQSALSFEHWAGDHPLVQQKCQRTLVVRGCF